MVATLTVSGSQVICTALQTILDISRDKQHFLERFFTQLQGYDIGKVHYAEHPIFIKVKLKVI